MSNSYKYTLCWFILGSIFQGYALDASALQSTKGSYTSIQVNVDAVGENIAGDAANETSIAINPTNPDNMVIVWRQFNQPHLIDSPKAGIAYSLDGGSNWTYQGPLKANQNRTDPVVDVDSLGNFYYQSLRTSGSREVDVFKSTDGGISWQEPVFSFGVDGDKNWLAIDRSGGSSDGFIYSYWRESPDPKHFSRSIDQGISFQTPVNVDSPNDPVYGTLTVGPDSTVYIAGRSEQSGLQRPNELPRLYFDPFRLVKSVDAQTPSATPTFTSQELDMGGSAVTYLHRNKPNPAGQLSQVNITVDHSQEESRGNVYVLTSLEPDNRDDPEDIHFIRSVDGGNTWSSPVRVNDDPPAQDSWQWFSTMSVAPNSRIDVVWYDTRNTDGYQISELFYAYSWDAGQTWSENIPVSQPFNTHIGLPLSSNKIGDYIGTDSDASGMNVAYPATFNGEQDIYFVRLFPDCNKNSLSDVNDINQGVSQDTNANHIPDECEVTVIPGDIDNDGDVDKDDMRIVLVSRNTPASGSNDPKDLDGDNSITALDARKVRLLCTRPRCATQ